MNKKIIIFIVSLFFLSSAFASMALFQEPEDGRQPVLQGINQAQNSIKMTIYMLTDDDVINALEDAAKRGVNVQVMLEPNPYQATSTTKKALTPDPGQQKIFNELAATGIHVEWTNPIFSLTHEKSMVIDDATAYILTLNLTHHAFSVNREFGVIDTDTQDVGEIDRVFDADWNRYTPTLNQDDLLWSPVNSRDKMETIIKSATKSLLIENEEVNDDAIEALLKQKVQDGVTVQMILPLSTPITDREAVLIKAGVNLRFLDQNNGQLYMHAKMIVADGQNAFVGSENISYFSLNSNRELGILIQSFNSTQQAQIVNHLKTVFNTDWKNSISGI